MFDAPVVTVLEFQALLELELEVELEVELELEVEVELEVVLELELELELEVELEVELEKQCCLDLYPILHSMTVLEEVPSHNYQAIL